MVTSEGAGGEVVGGAVGGGRSGDTGSLLLSLSHSPPARGGKVTGRIRHKTVLHSHAGYRTTRTCAVKFFFDVVCACICFVTLCVYVCVRVCE